MLTRQRDSPAGLDLGRVRTGAYPQRRLLLLPLAFCRVDAHRIGALRDRTHGFTGAAGSGGKGGHRGLRATKSQASHPPRDGLNVKGEAARVRQRTRQHVEDDAALNGPAKSFQMHLG